MTTLPRSWAGNALLGAFAWRVPVALPGGINPVRWSADFQSDTPGLTVNWQWAAAAYSTMGGDCDADQVKPVDGTHLSEYQSSDHAGTPEAFKTYVIGGARGGGGSNYAGSLSGTASVQPSSSSSMCAGVTCTASDQCHEAGACDPATGVCSNPAKADGTACSDGSACTTIDTCIAGTCTGANPITCAAMDQCHEAGARDLATGACSNPVKADGTACTDGIGCTQSDTCQAGACTGSSPVVCSASDQCHDVGTCNPTTGACSNPAKADGRAARSYRALFDDSQLEGCDELA